MLSITRLFCSKKMGNLPRFAKQFIVLTTDTGLCVLAVWIAFYLRLGQSISYSEGPILAATIFSVILALPILFFSGLYLSIFRHARNGEASLVFQAVGLYAFIYAGVITGIGVPGIPKTIGLIQPLLLVIFITGSRWLAFLCLSQPYRGLLPRALIYGAGKAGQELLAALEINNQIKIVGFLDDDKKLHGHTINGKPIFSQQALPNLMSSKGITRVLLAIPSASRRHRNDIIKNIESYQISVYTIPSLLDLTEGRVTVSDLQELDMNDLLGREVVKPDDLLLTKNTTGKVILVASSADKSYDIIQASCCC
jgi:FlaA1/EpsC-like NDP-sugar epimerase